jgi:hypothetical protein
MEDDDYTDSECDSKCEYGADVHDPKDDSDSDLDSNASLETSLKAPSKAQSHTSTSTIADALKRSSLPPTGPKSRQSQHSIGHRQWALILYAQKEPYFRITALTNIAETTVRKISC